MTEMSIEEALRQAVSFHQAGRLADAEKLYRAIIQVRPGHPEANYNLGALAVQVGRPEVALDYLKTALVINPSVAQFWVSYGDALLSCGQSAAARSLLEQAAERGIIGEGLDALKAKIAASTADPLSPAIAYVKVGKSTEAIAWLADYLRRSPDDAKALAQLGELLRHQPSQLDEALSFLSRALKIDPRLPMAWLSYGSALHQAKRDNEAKVAFVNVLKLIPNRVEALNDLGAIYLDEENWQEAADLFEKACSLAPDVPDLLMNYATAQAKLGRINEAETAVKRIQALGHGDRLGSTMFLAKLGKEPIPARVANSVLKTIYALRAEGWDKGSLEGEQRYRGAELVAATLRQVVDGAPDILDAGCGTGLVGNLIAHQARRLDGVDLSHEMLEKARAKYIYQSLYESEIVDFFSNHPSCYDVITCAATFIHFGDLLVPLSAAATCLRKNGLLIFTVFPNDEDKDAYEIGPITGSTQGGLYEHGERYLVKTAKAAGFAVEVLKREVHEYFKGKPKIGLIVALRKI